VANLGQVTSQRSYIENGGYLYAFDLNSEKSSLLSISVESDMTYARRPSSEPAVYQFIQPFAFGSKGIVLERVGNFYRPAKKGDVRDLTNTPAVRELWPTWFSRRKMDCLFLGQIRGIRNLCSRTDGSGDKARYHRWTRVQIWSCLVTDSTKILVAEKT